MNKMRAMFRINNYINRHNLIIALAESGYSVTVKEVDKSHSWELPVYIVCVTDDESGQAVTGDGTDTWNVPLTTAEGEA
jgi:hypothetical protein